MAHELNPWKQAGCTLSLKVSNFSQREPFSREINEKHGEGGALNANYRTAEALAVISNRLGLHCLAYGIDFVFKTAGDTVVLDFCDKETMERASHIFA